MSFKNLRAELARKNMSIKDLSIAIDMPYPTLARKCAGNTDFTYSEILKILNVFNTTFEYLFERKN